MADPRAVVEALVETLNAHDGVAGRALYAADARLIGATGKELGLDGVDRMISATFAAFPDMRVRVDRWIVDGDTVVTEEVMSGTHAGDVGGVAATHRTVELPMVHVTRVVDGRIAERVAYYDTAGILRQLT